MFQKPHLRDHLSMAWKRINFFSLLPVVGVPPSRLADEFRFLRMAEIIIRFRIKQMFIMVVSLGRSQYLCRRFICGRPGVRKFF